VTLVIHDHARRKFTGDEPADKAVHYDRLPGDVHPWVLRGPPDSPASVGVLIERFDPGGNHRQDVIE
jgi:hypothetical protein